MKFILGFVFMALSLGTTFAAQAKVTIYKNLDAAQFALEQTEVREQIQTGELLTLSVNEDVSKADDSGGKTFKVQYVYGINQIGPRNCYGSAEVKMKIVNHNVHGSIITGSELVLSKVAIPRCQK